MYTYDDWLGDRITEKSQFPDTYLGNDYPLILFSELVRRGEMDAETYNLIDEKQLETFERSVMMHVSAFKKLIKKSLSKAINPGEFLEFELHRLEKIMNDNYDAYHNSNIGIEYHYITGGTYKRVIDQWAKFIRGDRYNLLGIGKANEDLNFRMFTLRLQIDFVKEELTNLDEPGQVNINPKLTLNDVLIPGIKPETVKNNYLVYFSAYTSKAYLLKYLRHLSDKGYYSRKISWEETFTIAQNDFHVAASRQNRKHTPPLISDPDYKKEPYSFIPEAGELLK